MWRRQSRAAVLERDLSEAGSRAAETISELAEHAVAIAREAGHAATPAIHHSAEGLSKALERAAAALAEAGERFARTGEHQAAGATAAARVRIADATEKLADAVRPKKKHHRVRNLFIAAAVAGGVIALVQSPLRAKVTERLFGPPPEDELDSITLPSADPLPPSTPEPSAEISGTGPAGSPDGNGVASAPAGHADAAKS
jgi:hypothetical protein